MTFVHLHHGELVFYDDVCPECPAWMFATDVDIDDEPEVPSD